MVDRDLEALILDTIPLCLGLDERFTGAMLYSCLAEQSPTLDLDAIHAALDRLTRTEGSGLRCLRHSLHLWDSWYILDSPETRRAGATTDPGSQRERERERE